MRLWKPDASYDSNSADWGVGEPGPGQVRLRQAVGARSLGLHHCDQLAQFP